MKRRESCGPHNPGTEGKGSWAEGEAPGRRSRNQRENSPILGGSDGRRGLGEGEQRRPCPGGQGRDRVRKDYSA